mgnify:FL=1
MNCPKSYDKKDFTSKVAYQFVICNLRYAMIATRPDIAFAVGVNIE